MTVPRWASPALIAALLVAAPFASAQDGPKDDALEKLLRKVESTPPPDKPGPSDATRPGGLDAKDDALDSLLKKLGETRDEAAPQGPPGPGDASVPEPIPPDDPSGDLKGDEKQIDDHLYDLLGRKRKDRDSKQSSGPKGQAEESGPLSEAIKKMVEARRRLGESGTGEETREAQEQVVKELDAILERIRNASGQGSGKGRLVSRRMREAGNKGGQPGPQQGDPGNTGAGVGPTKPMRPTAKGVAANDKDIWGDLPLQLREQMQNVLNEEELPSRSDLIERYFMSLSKKGRAREE